VLVTCGGGLQGMTVYKSLRVFKSLMTHLFDSNQENVSKYFFEHFFHSSLVRQEKRYEEELFGYCKLHDIRLVIPATQFDLLFLSRRKQEFEKRLNCRIAVPDEVHVKVFLDKVASRRFLKEKGFPVQELADPLSRNHYPLIGKPLDGWGGKGVVVLKDIDGLQQFHGKREDYIWTGYIKDFKEYSIDFSVDHRGQISVPIARERLMISGGIALVSKRFDLPEAYASRIAQSFSDPAFSGIYNLQYISCSEGDFFTDLNPRIGTSAVIGSRTAANPVGHLLGLSNKFPPSDGVSKVIRYLDELHLPVDNDQIDQLQEPSSSRLPAHERSRDEVIKNRNKEIARKMMEEGLPLDQIVRITGLSEKVIESSL